MQVCSKIALKNKSMFKQRIEKRNKSIDIRIPMGGLNLSVEETPNSDFISHSMMRTQERGQFTPKGVLPISRQNMT